MYYQADCGLRQPNDIYWNSVSICSSYVRNEYKIFKICSFYIAYINNFLNVFFHILSCHPKPFLELKVWIILYSHHSIHVIIRYIMLIFTINFENCNKICEVISNGNKNEIFYIKNLTLCHLFFIYEKSKKSYI